MIRRKREREPRDRGQGLAELMVILPLLLMVFVGMAEVGWWAHSYLAVISAARAGARFASRGYRVPPTQVVEVTRVALGEGLSPQFGGPEANTAIIASLVYVEKDGSYTFDLADPEGRFRAAEGDLSVTSEVCDAPTCAVDIGEVANTNKDYNDQFCTSTDGCLGDFVVVEVFYRHKLLLNMSFIQDYIPEVLLIHGRSVMRVTPRRPVTP